jgi:phosphatidate cytidylyltransferase
MTGTPTPPTSGQQAAGGHGRAGRNLPAAIGIGAVLGACVLVPLYTVKEIFLGFLGVMVLIGLYELVRSMRAGGRHAPYVPLAAGTAAMIALAYTSGEEAFVVTGLLTGLAALVWRLGEGGDGLLDDIGSAFLALAYVSFLTGFAVLMLVPDDGPRRVTAFVATTVCADVGGYATGALFGRHPMAPSVSPKKSWEGLAGSLVLCVGAGVGFVFALLGGAVWQGIVFGVVIAPVAVLGDLGASMIKRDLGIKDFGRLLPGHGGVMDRIDSLLPAAPLAYLLLAAFIPT